MSVITATGQRCGPRNWMRTVLLMAGFALLLAVPHPAGAEENHDPAKAGASQAWGCNRLGGDAQVETVSSVWPVESVKSTTVTCKGGVLDGLKCANYEIGTHCWFPASLTDRPDDGSRAPAAEIAEAFESGALERIEAVVAELEAAQANGRVAARNATDEEPAAQRRVARDDNGDHDRDTNTHKKGKHGKHGKQGGKHRKR